MPADVTRIALGTLLVLSAFPVACHKHARARNEPDVTRVVKDTVRVVTPITDPSVVAFFRDTGAVSVFDRQAQTFTLATPRQRQSLHATLRKERELWQARKPRDYRFLLRVGCFCPGPRGWLLMDVRGGEPLRAWDRTGKAAALADWNTFSIDGLYDNLERAADNVDNFRIAFDPRWHFPTYVTTSLRMPDTWGVIEVRGFRQIR